MLVGGHVSPAGGLPNAHARGVERGCDAIQVFHQSPRAWRPTRHSPEAIGSFRELMADGPVRSIVIHAVYLINCASREPEIREKSLASLVHALRLGDAVGADGVVLHPGSQKGEPLEECLPRIGEALRHGLGESERCPLLLENTAGMTGTIGRTFGELADLIARAGGGERLGVCLDCCHLLASGFDVRSAEGLSAVVDDCAAEVGLERIGCLHVNDSQVPLGANRDRHANLPEGELGSEGLRAFLSEPRFEGLAAVMDDCAAEVGLERIGCLHVNDSQVPLGANRDRHANLPEGELGSEGLRAFLSEPRFEGLPALLEVPGPDGRGPDAEQIAIAKRLRAEGLAGRGVT